MNSKGKSNEQVSSRVWCHIYALCPVQMASFLVLFLVANCAIRQSNDIGFVFVKLVRGVTESFKT